MKNLIKSVQGTYISKLSVTLLLIFIGVFQCEAQSRTTLSKEERHAIDVLYETNYIGAGVGGWTISPDLWNMYNFSERKNFTEKLSIYFKNYTEAGKEMSGFCYFYNMATKKKIARWSKNEYKEY